MIDNKAFAKIYTNSLDKMMFHGIIILYRCTYVHKKVVYIEQKTSIWTPKTVTNVSYWRNFSNGRIVLLTKHYLVGIGREKSRFVIQA